MNDIEVKKEVEDVDSIEDCLPELTKLLEQVKREAVEEDAPADVEEILKNFANDETESESDSADDADIQKLQELLKQKQRELEESEEILKRQSRRKRKPEDENENNQQEKRIKNDEEQTTTSSINNEIHENKPSEESVILVKKEKLPTEEELESLLRVVDNFDEESCTSNQLNQEVDAYTSPIHFDYEANPPNDLDNFFDSVPSNNAVQTVPEEDKEDELQCLPVVNSAEFAGIPTFRRIKLERPASDQPEASADATDETPKEKRQRIFNTCMSLLERLECSESSGKFIFTPTITNSDTTAVCNSVLQNISNVHFDFQSIGPKLNLMDWGLKAIGSANKQIAKAIGISAETYFSKIKQKADTMAGKLIKVETDRNCQKGEQEMDIDEPNLSTFVKSSATQTEPLMCQKCVARSRIVGHDIGTQARVYTSSFGTQTSSTGTDYSELSAGLNEIQLKALYEFSHLIRSSLGNPSIERFQARAMDIYNILQNESKTPSSPYNAPTRDSSQDHRRLFPPNVSSYPTHNQHQPLNTQRAYNPPTGPSHPPRMAPPAFHSSNQTVRLPSFRDPRQASVNPPPPAQPFHPSNHGMPHMPPRDPRHAHMNPSPPQTYWNSPPPENFLSYPPPGAPDTLRPPPSGNYSVHPAAPSTNYRHPPTVRENRVAYGRGHRL